MLFKKTIFFYFFISSGSDYAYSIFTVDMDKFSIIASKNVSESIASKNYPTSWLPYSTNTSYCTSANDLGVATISPFDLKTLQKEKESTTLKLNEVYFGGGSGNTSTNNLIVCGSTTQSYYQILDVKKNFQMTSEMIPQYGCGFLIFLLETEIFSIVSEMDRDIGLQLFNINEPLPKKMSPTLIYQGGYPINLLGDKNNVFIGTRLWEDQDNSTIIQIDVSDQNNFQKLDEMNVPSPWVIFNYAPSIQSLGLSPEIQQFAMILLSDSSDRKILVVDYDDQLA